jgi:hypothetical protein
MIALELDERQADKRLGAADEDAPPIERVLVVQ